MGTKTNHQQNPIQQDKNNKPNSSTWLLNWFSQLTKSNFTNKGIPTTSTTKTTAKTTILPWKNKSASSSVTSSIAITEPINVPTVNYTPASYHTNNSQQSTLKYNRKKLQEHRPSITISLTPSVISSERRNSQQTISSSFTTSDDQYSTTAASYYQRRDSTDRSLLSELWSKARRRHPNYPKFHWPHRSTQSLSTSPNQIQQQQQQQQQHRIGIDQQDPITTSCPSSYRHHHYFPRHLKRHSISSLMTSADNTPSVSRPNSVMYTPSQPASPNFAALLVKNSREDEDIDNYWLSGDKEDNCFCQHDLKKERWMIKHELAKLAIDGLFAIPDMVTLPLSIEKHVLQIGCGDAAWAIDVASQHPRWIVIGLDDSNALNMSSTKRSIPRNLKLIRQPSLLHGLKSLPDQTFDFISSRFLLLGYTFNEYQELMTECLRLCKPGGYIEVMEMDMRIYHQRLLSYSTTQLLNNEVISVIESKSLDPRMARRLQDLVIEEQQSLLDTTEAKYISLPLGVWGGRLGVMFRDDIHTLFESYQYDVAELKKLPCRTEDDLEYKMDIMDNEIDSNHAFMNLHLMMLQTNK